ncbi:MAG: exodeoxyribonuclease III [Flavobacteriales bacterium]|nr:exodeoxyribonuclease III [Flavobacteriales bacterium]|tara:strand:+ start:392 stop:1156 length:765 start_codon:yes stop_codon:yes gene_type:complete
MKLLSFNVNGVRAAAGKTLVEDLHKLDCDVVGLQETKATPDQVKEALSELRGYFIYAFSAEKKGYSGTAILSKVEPLSVTNGIGIPIHDNEGRSITAEFEEFFYVTVYVPNSSSGLKRIDYRTKEWDVAFLKYLKKLEQTKPVVVCGDLNVAHQEIDLKNPKSNYNKTPGYTQAEIDGLTTALASGFVDTFRSLNPQTIKYSWWSYRGGARPKNVGWRLDYFLVSESLMSQVKDSEILNDILGSDHCPVQLTIF